MTSAVLHKVQIMLWMPAHVRIYIYLCKLDLADEFEYVQVHLLTEPGRIQCAVLCKRGKDARAWRVWLLCDAHFEQCDVHMCVRELKNSQAMRGLNSNIGTCAKTDSDMSRQRRTVTCLVKDRQWHVSSKTDSDMSRQRQTVTCLVKDRQWHVSLNFQSIYIRVYIHTQRVSYLLPGRLVSPDRYIIMARGQHRTPSDFVLSPTVRLGWWYVGTLVSFPVHAIRACVHQCIV
jgi:hypothetical protein